MTFLIDQTVRSKFTKTEFTIVARQEDTIDGQEVYTIKMRTGPHAEIFMPALGGDLEPVE